MNASAELDRAFAAMADSTRRGMVARLADGDATLTDLAADYDMSLQAVSRHLKVLEGAGIVSRTRDGQRRPAHLEPQVLDRMTAWIDGYRRQAEQRYQRLDALLERMGTTEEDTP